MKKMTYNEVEKFVTDGYNMMTKAKKICADLLKDFPNKELKFEWEDGDAPSISSGGFGEDLADAYISRIYLDGDLLMADLHAYYIVEDIFGVDLADECGVDYLDILDYINNNREDR